MTVEGAEHNSNLSFRDTRSVDPESILPHECWEKWIPGPRQEARPGMTVS